MARERTIFGATRVAAIRPYLLVSLKRGWKRFRKRLQRCQAKFSEAAVHHSRVESRRLLSTLELTDALFPNKHSDQARKNLKGFLSAFDELRDTQVQLILVGRSVRHRPGLRVLRAALRKRERRWKKRTAQRIERAKLTRLRRAVRALKSQLRRPKRGRLLRRLSPGALVRVLNREFGCVQELHRKVRPSDTATIHRVRVAFKLYRYMVEAVGRLLPGVTGKKIEAMKAFQALMGEIRDNEILLFTVKDFMRKEKLDPACGAEFRDELVRRNRRLVAAYLRRARQLERFWPWPDAAKKPVPPPSGRVSESTAQPTVSSP